MLTMAGHELTCNLFVAQSRHELPMSPTRISCCLRHSCPFPKRINHALVIYSLSFLVIHYGSQVGDSLVVVDVKASGRLIEKFAFLTGTHKGNFILQPY